MTLSEPSQNILQTSGTRADVMTDVMNAIRDPARMTVLERSDLLDTPPEDAFDRLTRLACRMLRTPVALVSLVDRDRQFFKSATVHLEGTDFPGETPLEYSFCKHVVSLGTPLVISDARQNPLVQENLAATELGIVAYAGIPLVTSEGHPLGSFCAIDMVAREWTPDEIEILQDLAGAALTEIELRLAARQLRENVVELQRTEAQRDSLMRMIVHDLRTPLSSYLAGLQAMSAVGNLSETQHQMLGISIAGGNSLRRMIDDLLDVARLEAVLASQAELYRTEITVDELVTRTKNQVAQLAERAGLELEITVAPEIPSLQIDSSLIERVLVNLLGNAIKFTSPPGRVELRVESEEGESCQIHFRVCDTGVGIEPNDYERIFELFGQASARNAGHELSTGLGLAFCKLAVEAHGGRIWVESHLGQGSTFHVTLPL